MRRDEELKIVRLRIALSGSIAAMARRSWVAPKASADGGTSVVLLAVRLLAVVELSVSRSPSIDSGGGDGGSGVQTPHVTGQLHDGDEKCQAGDGMPRVERAVAASLAAQRARGLPHLWHWPKSVFPTHALVTHPGSYFVSHEHV